MLGMTALTSRMTFAFALASNDSSFTANKVFSAGFSCKGRRKRGKSCQCPELRQHRARRRLTSGSASAAGAAAAAGAAPPAGMAISVMLSFSYFFRIGTQKT